MLVNTADLSNCPTRWSYEKDPTGSLISSFTATSKWNSPSLPATCSAIWGSSWNLKTQRNSSYNRILPCNVHYPPANFSLPEVTLWWCTRLNFIKATAVLGSKPKSQFYCKSKLADRILKPFHEDAASEQTFFFFNIHTRFSTCSNEDCEENIYVFFCKLQWCQSISNQQGAEALTITAERLRRGLTPVFLTSKAPSVALYKVFN